MRWFWIAVGVAAAAIAVLAYGGFFSTFRSNDWTTFGLSLAAVLGTVYGIVRNSTPKPHWSTTPWKAIAISPYANNLLAGFQVTFTQEGPGVAERVRFEYWLRDKEAWGEPLLL